MVAGGFIPLNLRGTSCSTLMHVADCESSLCFLMSGTANQEVIASLNVCTHHINIYHDWVIMWILLTGYVTLTTLVGVDPSDPVEIAGAVHDVGSYHTVFLDHRFPLPAFECLTLSCAQEDNPDSNE